MRKGTFERDLDLLLFFLPLDRDLDLERDDDELENDRERLRRRRRLRSAERFRDLDRLRFCRLRLSLLRLLDFTESLVSRLRSGEDFFSDLGINFRTDFLI